LNPIRVIKIGKTEGVFRMEPTMVGFSSGGRRVKYRFHK